MGDVCGFVGEVEVNVVVDYFLFLWSREDVVEDDGWRWCFDFESCFGSVCVEVEIVVVSDIEVVVWCVVF